jgi:hypothetical protein
MNGVAKNIRRGVNAGENPLRSELIERLPIRFEAGSWSEMLKRVQQLNFRAAIVGSKGSGKTCLLEQLHQRIGQHYLNLPLDRRLHDDQMRAALDASENGNVVLLDGIERLGFWQRQKLFARTKSGPGLIVTVHHPCRLPTWIRFRTNIGLMKQLLNDLDIATPEVLEAGEIAFRNAKGNMREAFRSLYDQFADGCLSHVGSGRSNASQRNCKVVSIGGGGTP